MRSKAYALVGCCLWSFAALESARAEDWPQWRGTQRDGTSQENGFKDTFKEAPKVLWEAKVGLGFSSFVVADGKVYTTGFADGKDTVFCFDTVSGKEVWKHSYPAELGDKYFEGGTTGTPTIADGVLYHLSRWGDMIAYEAATGKVLWQKNVHKETGIELPEWGYSGSPLVWGDMVILNVGEGGVALKKSDGAVAWKSEEGKAGYSTPFPYKQGGKDYVVLGTGRSYVAVDPENGKQLWEHRWNTSYGVNAADPIVKGDLMLISSGYNKGSALLKLGSTEPEELWTTRELRSQMNSAVLVDGFVYGIDGNAERNAASLKCLEFATGKPKWEDKSVGYGGLMVADGKLIVLNEKGELLIAPVNAEKFEPTTRVQVLNAKCWAVPVLANGLVFVRDVPGTVKCLDLRKD